MFHTLRQVTIGAAAAVVISVIVLVLVNLVGWSSAPVIQRGDVANTEVVVTTVVVVK